VAPSQLLRDINVGEIAVSLASFADAFVAIVVVGRYVVIPTTGRLLEQTSVDDAVRSLLTSTVGTLVWVVAFVIAMTLAGYGAVLSAFAIFGSVIALAVGFAAQDLLGNFVAGIFIRYDKPFEVGDWIEWNDNSGRIEDIDLRVSRIRAFDNEQIAVPNGELANNAVTNPVAYETLRQKFTFGISYDDIDRATDVILAETERHEDIMDDPAPRSVSSNSATRRSGSSRGSGSGIPRVPASSRPAASTSRR
jgi:small-conductance mechanosensitive channel